MQVNYFLTDCIILVIAYTIKQQLKAQYETLNPAELHRKIVKLQKKLYSLATPLKGCIMSRFSHEVSTSISCSFFREAIGGKQCYSPKNTLSTVCSSPVE